MYSDITGPTAARIKSMGFFVVVAEGFSLVLPFLVEEWGMNRAEG